MDESADLLVGSGLLVTRDAQQSLIESGGVAVCGDRIVQTGTTAALRQRFPDAEFIDAHGGLILPGLINAHMHLYSTFARGMALKDAAPGNLVEILERLWWRLDKVLTTEDVYLSALVAMIACVKNGVTTIFDHHSSPGSVAGSLLRIAGAARETGLRSCLCYEVTDREGEAVAAESIAENRSFLAYCRESREPLLRALFGVHASFTVSDETVRRSRNVAAEFDAGFHVHAAEAESDVTACQREHGKRVIERFNDLGILGSKTIAAHCVHVNDHEIDLLAASRTFVVHNPESNMGNAVGCAPVLEMVRRGVRVGLGSDGYTADMFESLKVANLLHKHQAGQPGVGWTEPPAMLFTQNAEFAGSVFGHTVGKLVPGALADVIVVDYDAPTPMTATNLDSHLLFGVSGRGVRTTVIGGRIAMKDREVCDLDEAEIMSRARAAAAKLWQRF